MARPPLAFDTRVDTAAQLATRARIFLDVWWYYDGPTRGDILPSLNRYSEFFKFDPHAHFVSFIVHLSALFENRDDTINIPQLLSEAVSVGVRQEVVDRMQARLLRTEAVVPKTIILRSNLFAHRTATLSYDEVFRIAKVTPDELRALSDSSIEVMNELAEQVGVRVSFVNDVPVRHLRELIDALGKQTGA